MGWIHASEEPDPKEWDQAPKNENGNVIVRWHSLPEKPKLPPAWKVLYDYVMRKIRNLPPVERKYLGSIPPELVCLAVVFAFDEAINLFDPVEELDPDFFEWIDENFQSFIDEVAPVWFKIRRRMKLSVEEIKWVCPVSIHGYGIYVPYECFPDGHSVPSI